jgi:hypothetical protein
VRERGEVVPGDVQPFDEREVLRLTRVARREAQLGDPALDAWDGGDAQLDPDPCHLVRIRLGHEPQGQLLGLLDRRGEPSDELRCRERVVMNGIEPGLHHTERAVPDPGDADERRHQHGEETRELPGDGQSPSGRDVLPGRDPYSAPRCSARLEQTLPSLIDELGVALERRRPSGPARTLDDSF